MKSPQHMRIIQIDITNACMHQCSNCTRFCGHHKKPFFMDYETFKRAVDSLEDYIGTVGIMGGEPTLHPEFERFAQYVKRKYSNIYLQRENHFIYPQKDFMSAVFEREMENTIGYDSGIGTRQTMVGPGLWSAMGKNYRKHYELIQDTFRYQAVNDHINPMYHQPALITRKELGIGDEEWIELRDACWIQNEWSATITPKGAFFCEVAGALDMLFGGPGGWVIEPGWWKRDTSDFGEQLNWCEMCGLACHTFTRDANEEIDDVSPTMIEKLKSIDSPKMAKGKINEVVIQNGKISEKSIVSDKRFSKTMPYTESYEARFNEQNSSLFVQKVICCIISGDENKTEANPIKVEAYKKTFDEVIIETDMSLKFGEGLNKILGTLGDNDALLILSGNYDFDLGMVKLIRERILNPGSLLVSGEGGKFAALIFKNALSLRKYGYDRIARAESVWDIVSAWEQKKVLGLDALNGYVLADIKIKPETRYIVYGAGNVGKITVDKIRRVGSEIVAVVDSNPERIGSDFEGITIQTPECIIELGNKFDKVVIASVFYFYEIQQTLLKLGVDSNKFVFMR